MKRKRYTEEQIIVTSSPISGQVFVEKSGLLVLLCELLRCLVGQRLMRPVLVVINTPSFDLLARVVKREEPVHVQTFIPEAAVESTSPRFQ